jgi:hypothetical protein
VDSEISSSFKNNSLTYKYSERAEVFLSPKLGGKLVNIGIIGNEELRFL